MEGEGTGEAFIAFVNAFEDIPHPVETLEDLSDGCVLHHMLREIAPDSFAEGTVKLNVGSNAILKGNNLKKLVRELESYYTGVLLQSLDVDSIDTDAIAKGTTDEIIKLGEFVLGCAVQCDDKHRYIQKVMSLDKASQASLMVLTQRILARGEQAALDRSGSDLLDSTLNEDEENPAGRDLAEQEEELRKLQARVRELETANEELNNRYNAVNEKVSDLNADFKNATEERSKFEKLYNEALESSMQGQSKNDSATNSDLEMKVFQQEGEINELKEKLAAHSGTKEDNLKLKDDLQLKESEISELNTEISKLKGYKEKLEQAGDLKRKLQDKEAEGDKLLEQVVELEHSLDRVKKESEEKDRQLEALKAKVTALEASSGGNGASGGSEVSAALQEKLDLVEGKHQEALLELKTVRSELERVKAEQDTAEESQGEAVSTAGDAANVMELKKTVARLNRENQEMKSKLESSPPSASASSSETPDPELKNNVLRLESELSVSKATVKTLGDEKAALQDEVVSLRAQVGVNAGTSEHLGGELGRLRKQNEDLQSAMEKMRGEISQHVEDKGQLMGAKDKEAQEKIELERRAFEAEKKTWEAEQKIKGMEEKLKSAASGDAKEQTDDLLMAENRQLKAELTERRKLLQRKDEELTEHIRMKNELQIAVADSTQASVLQQQIRDMQRREEEQAKANKRKLAAQEREQKLVVSLMYDLGMELHRTKMYQRSNVEKPPLLSWLAKRRQEMSEAGE